MRCFELQGVRRAGHLAAWMSLIACASLTAVAHAQQTEPAETRSAPAVQSILGEAASEVGPPAGTDTTSVNFVADIEPILVMHCQKCHGPEKQSSGLRLDAREFAQRGGDSGKPVLGGTPETNELLARVSSTDRTYRMPKNAPALAPREIALLRRWVEQGTPWPVPFTVPQSVSFYDRWLNKIVSWVDRYEAEYNYAYPYTIAFLVLSSLLLVVIRCRTAYRRGRAWTSGRIEGFCKFCDGVNSRELLLVMLLLFAGLALAVARGHMLVIDRALERTQYTRAGTESPWSHTVYGWPPKPIRSDHPKQVAGTYYRGNCERNAELFNGGDYLTAIFRVSLCDQEHRQLDVGQPLPDGGVFVRVEIERAPGTSDALFSKELMASVVLVKNFYEPPDNRLKEKPVRLEILEADQRWAAYVPTGKPADGGSLGGQIYIYTGQVDNGMLQGSLQYGVQFELQFAADGKLAPESDLWMDSFGNSAFADPRPPGKLPYNEWFDYRPIPLITGENSKDPKLLGVDEYVKKGLIQGDAEKKPARAQKPPPSPQAVDPPDGE